MIHTTNLQFNTAEVRIGESVRMEEDMRRRPAPFGYRHVYVLILF